MIKMKLGHDLNEKQVFFQQKQGAFGPLHNYVFDKFHLIFKEFLTILGVTKISNSFLVSVF